MKSKDPLFIKKVVKWFWIIFSTALLSVILIFVLIITGVIGYMPPLEELENPIDKYASQVFSVDMKLLGTYAQSKENRIYSTYEDLSPQLVQALIATEDARFQEHSGIDAYALFRSVVKRGILMQKSGGGGSTITQQLAKQLYSPHAEDLIERLLQKPIEWVIAVRLERMYTKEEILNMYLNKFDFLYNAVGIRSAAWVYFSKTPKTLSTEEAATLIGMCKNPSYYNPRRRAEAAKGRRNVVLDQMVKYGYLSRAACDSLQKKPLVLTFNKVDHKDGLAPYFREYLRMVMMAKKPSKNDYADWQADRYTQDSIHWETNPLYGWCNKNKKAGKSNYNLYIDGLKIYTTIDSRMQKYAEESIEQHLGSNLQDLFFKEKKNQTKAPFSNSVNNEEIQKIMERTMKQSDRYLSMKKDGKSDKEINQTFHTKTEMTVFSWKGLRDTIMTPWDSIRYMKYFLRSGFMCMEPHSGYVKAYVGGIDFQHFQYDMVNVGRRQVGSTIKPYLYALAMEEGMTPCDQILHVEQTLPTGGGKTWTPRNANKKMIGEMVSIRWGLQNSDNWITANLMGRISPMTFVRMLHSFGLTGHIDPVVSLCLGPCDVSIAEMVSGYSTFANKGVRTVPLYVTRIEDSYGNTIATFTPQMSEVLSEKAAAQILDMTRAVVDGGTGSRIRNRFGIRVPMGGKTGTTQNHSDGWFMGFTPSLVGGVWVGGEDRSIHFDRMAEGQAANMALPIFGIFLQKVFANPDLGYTQTETFSVSPQYRNVCPPSSILQEDSLHQSAGIDEMFR